MEYKKTSPSFPLCCMFSISLQLSLPCRIISYFQGTSTLQIWILLWLEERRLITICYPFLTSSLKWRKTTSSWLVTWQISMFRRVIWLILQKKVFSSSCDWVFVVFGLHLGVDGYMQRIRKDHVVKDDIQWNYQYYKGIKNTFGSLTYSHVVFGRCVW